MRSKSRPHPGNAGLALDHMSAGDKLALAMIPEIDIWRVAVLMVNRYADEAKANSDRRVEELAADGNHVGAAIWRRVTVAIEQLTDTAEPLH